ncbi:uncharacterized protein BJ171DRAFT_497878 [Polychytrium aggregatum]|uniref:uncharacterized protein n=1 Tax=Polychytrium aggregatum TaxID=110093 RepID=UPI0022FDE090|nr:uncharacterized protein BJ171DRAFT_497878 [Polychytrium aggregatum]KAI9206453.1 hypothetical protein BJ171DRAFT_497878 [Polychytrium aggregatum]
MASPDDWRGQLASAKLCMSEIRCKIQAHRQAIEKHNDEIKDLERQLMYCERQIQEVVMSLESNPSAVESASGSLEKTGSMTIKDPATVAAAIAAADRFIQDDASETQSDSKSGTNKVDPLAPAHPDLAQTAPSPNPSHPPNMLPAISVLSEEQPPSRPHIPLDFVRIASAPIAGLFENTVDNEVVVKPTDTEPELEPEAINLDAVDVDAVDVEPSHGFSSASIELDGKAANLLSASSFDPASSAPIGSIQTSSTAVANVDRDGPISAQSNTDADDIDVDVEIYEPGELPASAAESSDLPENASITQERTSQVTPATETSTLVTIMSLGATIAPGTALLVPPPFDVLLSAPTKPAPIDPTPIESAPISPAPVESAPIEPIGPPVTLLIPRAALMPELLVPPGLVISDHFAPSHSVFAPSPAGKDTNKPVGTVDPHASRLTDDQPAPETASTSGNKPLSNAIDDAVDSRAANRPSQPAATVVCETIGATGERSVDCATKIALDNPIDSSSLDEIIDKSLDDVLGTARSNTPGVIPGIGATTDVPEDSAAASIDKAPASLAHDLTSSTIAVPTPSIVANTAAPIVGGSIQAPLPPAISIPPDTLPANGTAVPSVPAPSAFPTFLEHGSDAPINAPPTTGYYEYALHQAKLSGEWPASYPSPTDVPITGIRYRELDQTAKQSMPLVSADPKGSLGAIHRPPNQIARPSTESGGAVPTSTTTARSGHHLSGPKIKIKPLKPYHRPGHAEPPAARPSVKPLSNAARPLGTHKTETASAKPPIVIKLTAQRPIHRPSEVNTGVQQRPVGSPQAPKATNANTNTNTGTSIGTSASTMPVPSGGATSVQLSSQSQRPIKPSHDLSHHSRVQQKDGPKPADVHSTPSKIQSLSHSLPPSVKHSAAITPQRSLSSHGEDPSSDSRSSAVSQRSHSSHKGNSSTARTPPPLVSKDVTVSLGSASSSDSDDGEEQLDYKIKRKSKSDSAVTPSKKMRTLEENMPIFMTHSKYLEIIANATSSLWSSVFGGPIQGGNVVFEFLDRVHEIINNEAVKISHESDKDEDGEKIEIFNFTETNDMRGILTDLVLPHDADSDQGEGRRKSRSTKCCKLQNFIGVDSDKKSFSHHVHEVATNRLQNHWRNYSANSKSVKTAERLTMLTLVWIGILRIEDFDIIMAAISTCPAFYDCLFEVYMSLRELCPDMMAEINMLYRYIGVFHTYGLIDRDNKNRLPLFWIYGKKEILIRPVEDSVRYIGYIFTTKEEILKQTKFLEVMSTKLQDLINDVITTDRLVFMCKFEPRKQYNRDLILVKNLMQKGGQRMFRTLRNLGCFYDSSDNDTTSPCTKSRHICTTDTVQRFRNKIQTLDTQTGIKFDSECGIWMFLSFCAFFEPSFSILHILLEKHEQYRRFKRFLTQHDIIHKAEKIDAHNTVVIDSEGKLLKL